MFDFLAYFSLIFLFFFLFFSWFTDFPAFSIDPKSFLFLFCFSIVKSDFGSSREVKSRGGSNFEEFLVISSLSAKRSPTVFSCAPFPLWPYFSVRGGTYGEELAKGLLDYTCLPCPASLSFRSFSFSFWHFFATTDLDERSPAYCQAIGNKLSLQLFPRASTSIMTPFPSRLPPF